MFSCNVISLIDAPVEVQHEQEDVFNMLNIYCSFQLSCLFIGGTKIIYSIGPGGLLIRQSWGKNLLLDP